MLTGMTERDWKLVVTLFRAARSGRGDRGRNDRRFLEAPHYFTIHNITWRALPERFGNWNSIWRLSRSGGAAQGSTCVAGGMAAEGIASCRHVRATTRKRRAPSRRKKTGLQQWKRLRASGASIAAI